MKTWTKAACLTLCAGLLVSGVAAGFAGKDDDAKKKAQPPAGDKPAGGEDPMMAAMMEMSKPVAEHEIIKNFAGSWDAEVKMWMDPSAKEPTVSKGKMKGTQLHGGRYLLGEFSGDFSGMPFSGTLMWGYNRVESRYESTWIDSFGTGILMATGKATADGKGVESTGTFRMPGPDGKTLMEITQREKTVMVSKDKYTLEMWHTMKGQGETKVMEITYTRAAAAAPGAAGAGITMPPKAH